MTITTNPTTGTAVIATSANGSVINAADNTVGTSAVLGTAIIGTEPNTSDHPNGFGEAQ